MNFISWLGFGTKADGKQKTVRAETSANMVQPVSSVIQHLAFQWGK